MPTAIEIVVDNQFLSRLDKSVAIGLKCLVCNNSQMRSLSGSVFGFTNWKPDESRLL